MIPFVRRTDGVHLTLSQGERMLLESLTAQFIQILGAGLAADPLATRLFPAAYRDDPEASAEFRRYTMDDLRMQKTENARSVQRWLVDGMTGPFDREAELAWLRCLTDLRLTVAERLGVGGQAVDDGPGDADEAPDDFGLRDVYEWLGALQEHLLMAVQGRRTGAR